MRQILHAAFDSIRGARRAVWASAVPSLLVCLFAVMASSAKLQAQAPLVPAPQPRRAIEPQEKPAEPPKRSRHAKKKRRAKPARPTHWGIIAGRPAASPMAVFHFAWPAAYGHRSRPVASPMAALNVVRDPRFTPYVPGRPLASHMSRMSLLTPHFVVRPAPQQLWIGGGRLRTARAPEDSSRR